MDNNIYINYAALCEALVQRNTHQLLRLIAKCIERGFTDGLNMQLREAKNHHGHGKPHLKKQSIKLHLESKVSCFQPTPRLTVYSSTPLMFAKRPPGANCKGGAFSKLLTDSIDKLKVFRPRSNHRGNRVDHHIYTETMPLIPSTKMTWNTCVAHTPH